MQNTNEPTWRTNHVAMAAQMKKLNDIKFQLSNNPFFALSLGSRELFHSNFLAWLLEQYPTMISALTASCAQRDFEVHREKYNFDLTVKFKDQGVPSSLIVEIKVKDTPKIDQLEIYDEKSQKNKNFLGESPEKLLISLTEAPLGIPKSWKIFNLAELASAIEDVAFGCDFEPAHHTLVQYYINLCRDLADLVQRIAIEDSKFRFFYSIAREKKPQAKV